MGELIKVDFKKKKRTPDSTKQVFKEALHDFGKSLRNVAVSLTAVKDAAFSELKERGARGIDRPLVIGKMAVGLGRLHMYLLMPILRYLIMNMKQGEQGYLVHFS